MGVSHIFGAGTSYRDTYTQESKLADQFEKIRREAIAAARRLSTSLPERHSAETEPQPLDIFISELAEMSFVGINSADELVPKMENLLHALDKTHEATAEGSDRLSTQLHRLTSAKLAQFHKQAASACNHTEVAKTVIARCLTADMRLGGLEEIAVKSTGLTELEDRRQALRLEVMLHAHTVLNQLNDEGKLFPRDDLLAGMRSTVRYEGDYVPFCEVANLVPKSHDDSLCHMFEHEGDVYHFLPLEAQNLCEGIPIGDASRDTRIDSPDNGTHPPGNNETEFNSICSFYPEQRAATSTRSDPSPDPP